MIKFLMARLGIYFIPAVAAFSLSAGAVGGWFIRGVQVAELQLEISELRRQTAEDRLGALSELHSRSERAWETLTAGVEQAGTALAARNRQIRNEEMKLRKRQEELSTDELYACRRRSLPPEYLDGLRRPGASVPAAAPGGGPPVH